MPRPVPLLASLTLRAALLVAAGATAAHARPRKKARQVHTLVAFTTFTNPILRGMNPDPSICRVGDDYYLVTSSFEYFPGVPIYHSRDLVNWRQIGHVLTTERQLDLAGVPSSGGIYAATIRYWDGVFYVITTLVHSPSGGGNFYVTARNPAGPWSDPMWLDREGFDPSLTFAEGKMYYLRDGKGADFSHPQIHMGTLDRTIGAIDEPLRPIWSGTGGVWPEGAHLYKLRGPYYYLFAAEGGTAYDHSEVVGRSPSPYGPFEPSPDNPILTHRRREGHPIQATGHADLVELPDGSTWAVFLGTRPQHDGDGRFNHLGRETFLAPVHWSDFGWPSIGAAGAPGTVELETTWPPLAPSPFTPRPARDQFDRPALAFDWSFVRNPDARDWSLAERPGFLRLHGSALTLDDAGSPAAVLRRQPDLRVRCSAALDFSPKQPNEEAGLTVRANESFHYDVAVHAAPPGPGQDKARAREAVLRRRLAGKSEVVGRAPLPDGPVRLRVAADEASYTFAVESDGGGSTVLGTLPTRALAAEEIDKHGPLHFTGAFVGVYATGGGRRSTAPADFDWFECSP
jgi:alpha-N-arabinofuranosidase